jgi:hypothetical protein
MTAQQIPICVEKDKEVHSLEDIGTLIGNMAVKNL